MHHPTDRIIHTTAFVTSRGALAGMRNSSIGPPHEGSWNVFIMENLWKFICVGIFLISIFFWLAIYYRILCVIYYLFIKTSIFIFYFIFQLYVVVKSASNTSVSVGNSVSTIATVNINVTLETNNTAPKFTKGEYFCSEYKEQGTLILSFSFQPVLHDWCNKGRGMCYPVCGMVHIKEPLLLIGKSSLCGSSGFPFSLSEWTLTICLTPYNCK